MIRRSLLACLALASLCEASDHPRLVVLITIDTLRADAVSFGRHNAGTTPFLASLAAGGTVFLDARAPSGWTPPSMASILTSLYPASHGVTHGILMSQGLAYQPRLPETLTTLAEAMHEAGYVTIGVPSNLHLAKKAGFSQGFDHYYGEANFLSAIAVNLKARQLLRQAYGLSWKVANRERFRHPCFLWLHYFDPHDPYGAAPRFITRIDPSFSTGDPHYPRNKVMRQIKATEPVIDRDLASCLRPLYESEIAYVDDRIRSFSQDLGLAEKDVLLVVTADHGEEFADHGGLGHAHSLYDELLRVPLFLRWPGHIPAGVRLSGAVGVIDIYKTILDLLGQSIPPGLQGESLVPRFRGDMPASPVFASLHAPKPELRSVIAGDDKLIVDRATGDTQLFDLADDPDEQRDLSGSSTGRKEELAALLDAWESNLPAPPETPRTGIDEATRRKLEAMGYGAD